MDKDISVTLKVWRQRGPKEKGQFETYKIEKINQSVSFLEMLDILNEQLVNEGKEPIVFDHDCREGICGMCSLYVNDTRTDRQLELRLASYICVVSTMERRSRSNRGVPQVSLLSAT